MRKRTSLLAVCAAANILVGFADDSHAQRRVSAADGCAVLADIVYSEIFTSTLYESSRLPPHPGPGDASSCDNTAASVSSGFSRAMAAMNVVVTWTVPDSQSESVCAGGDLLLCYPLPKPMMSRGSLDPASVTEMWQIVSGIVFRTMPTGTSSDLSSFREYELRTNLSSALLRTFPMMQGRDTR